VNAAGPGPAPRLAGKVALITGGGGGIGAATASLFCQQGASVMLVDMDSEGLARTAAAIREKSPAAGVVHMTANVADGKAAMEAVAQCLAKFGRIDVLVNNASMRNYSALADATREEWEAVVGVNMLGSANYCRAALPQLRKSGKAAIVNVSSCYAVTGRKGMGLYDATKAAMLAMTRTLAFEEVAHGVRVNAVCPGSTLTDFHVKRTQAAGKSVEEFKTQRQTTSLIGRWADPIEIAYPILWLASDEASFITGATLMVDGGLSIM
jgi:meso-butanediol dehydrogenase/(S,S)-butanediol dehydrogenase/diacetyl reductase